MDQSLAPDLEIHASANTAEREPFDQIRLVGGLSWPLFGAALYAFRNGLVTADEWPTPPDTQELPALAPWWAECHALLVGRGILDREHRERMASARIPACPSWCKGEHARILSTGDFGVTHRLPLYTFRLTARPDVALTLSLERYESDDGTLEPQCLALAGEFPEQLAPTDARILAAAFAFAAASLAALVGAE